VSSRARSPIPARASVRRCVRNVLAVIASTPARDVVGVDLAHELRMAVERAGRPERQPRRDPAPLELGARGAVEDQRAVVAKAGFERRSRERHTRILARPMETR
jgi:hypothetical protein